MKITANIGFISLLRCKVIINLYARRFADRFVKCFYKLKSFFGCLGPLATNIGTNAKWVVFHLYGKSFQHIYISSCSLVFCKSVVKCMHEWHAQEGNCSFVFTNAWVKKIGRKKLSFHIHFISDKNDFSSQQENYKPALFATGLHSTFIYTL